MVFFEALGKVALIVLVKMLFCSDFKFSKSSYIDCFTCAFGSSMYCRRCSNSSDNERLLSSHWRRDRLYATNKIENTFFFCSSEIYLQGFCSKLYIYTQELKGCDGINWLGIPVNDLYNI